MGTASVWLKEHKAEHNRQFAITPEAEGTAFVPDWEGAWRNILCGKAQRVRPEAVPPATKRSANAPPEPYGAHGRPSFRPRPSVHKEADS
jgi:hypothetical protein